MKTVCNITYSCIARYKIRQILLITIPCMEHCGCWRAKSGKYIYVNLCKSALYSG